MSLRTIMITALSSLLLAATAVAQTTPPPSPNTGAFDKLSPGNQKIVQALFDAEQANSTSTTTQPLSRDDIAAMKQNGKGWGEVFKELKSQGLVQEKNLGEVVSRESGKAGLKAPGGTSITTGSGRTFVAGTKVKPEHGSLNVGQPGNDLGRSGNTAGRSDIFSGSGRDFSSGSAGMGNMNRGSGHGKN